jgi:PiT family inorganic phosphate transporter
MLSLLILVILLALAFDFINGFHDTANAVAASVSTRVLTPRQAILMAAVLNFAGALVSTEVAATIGKGIVNPQFITTEVLSGALAGAIIWNLVTWYYGLPSSSSHALIGGMVGSVVAQSGFGILNYQGLIKKVVIPLLVSPLIGFGVGFLLMILLLWLFRKASPRGVTGHFSRLQVFSAAFMAFSHGSNDAQKSMGVITAALLAAGFLQQFVVPLWVVLACATVMAVGTSLGGWRIIKTMGSRITRLEPIYGFASDTASSLVILGASVFGAPVSTTHVVSSAIMGVGSTKRLTAVRWGVALNIVSAWVMTAPISAVIGALCYLLIKVTL